MTAIDQQIRSSSNQELAKWLRQIENRPEFINTASAIRDEMRRREVGKSFGATRKQ